MSIDHIECCKNYTMKIAMLVGVEKIRLSHVESNLTRKMLISVTAVVNTTTITGIVDEDRSIVCAI